MDKKRAQDAAPAAATKTPTTFVAKPVDEVSYAKYMAFLGGVLKRLGLTIRVFGDETLWKTGDIFLFNHFARLETVLPPYLIYSRGGAITRSVASKSLFKVHPRFTKFLSDNGALPTDLPGLLPYLAAEILRGRKMMIFPEGGMVKDRKVMHDGKFEITDEIQGVRKIHRGAAAIAQVLTLFKARIIMLEERGDTARLERWRQALDFADIQALLAAAHKPTRLVPAAMTFYPVRNAPNLFSKLARRLKPLSDQAEDELVVEGNLVTRATDLDVQLQEPLDVTPELAHWDTKLLDKVFLDVTSLDELFALRDKAEGWSQQLLSRKLAKKIDHLRDQYMERLYTGVRLNLTHLAAAMILQRHAAGDTVIELQRFREALYAAVHLLQHDKGVHLHSTLSDPLRYLSLATGEPNAHLNRIFDIAAQSGLVEVKGDKLHLLPALGAKWGVQQVRLKNPLIVAMNEAEPVPALAEAAKKAWAAKLTPAKKAALMWQDEISLYMQSHLKAATSDNVTKLPPEAGMPEFLAAKRMPKAHADRSKTGVLLVHGLLSSPAQMHAAAVFLNSLGHPVLSARIPGHGTSAWDLFDTPASAWLPAIRRQYDILAATCDKVVVVGFSTGAMLALRLAATRPAKLAGVSALAAPWHITERHLGLVPWVNRLNRLTYRLTGGNVYPLITYPTTTPEISYGFAPIPTVDALLREVKAMRRDLPLITAPTLVLQADGDPLVDPKSAQHIYDGLTHAEKKLVMVDANRHNLLTDLHPTVGLLLAKFAANPGATLHEKNDGA